MGDIDKLIFILAIIPVAVLSLPFRFIFTLSKNILKLVIIAVIIKALFLASKHVTISPTHYFYSGSHVSGACQPLEKFNLFAKRDSKYTTKWRDFFFFF